MAIQIRRGTDSEWESNKSNIVAGEPAVTLDSERMFVGTGSGTYMELANIDVLADPFDSSASYVVGDFTAYHGKLYKCNTDHSGAWNASNFDEVSLADALDALGDDVYTKAEADALLALKADKSDTYTKGEVDTALNGKADKSTTYTKTEVDSALSGIIDPTLSVAGKAADAKATGDRLNLLENNFSDYVAKLSDNLYNPATDTLNSAIDATGALISTPLRKLSDFIYVGNSTPYSFKTPESVADPNGALEASEWAYDPDTDTYTFIRRRGASYGSSQTFTSPSTCTHIRLNVLSTSAPIMVNIGNSLKTYEPYGLKYVSYFTDMKNDIEDLKDDMLKNTFEKTGNTININVKGKFGYEIIRKTNAGINIDTWLINETSVNNTVLQSQSDIEGPIQLNGEADFIGGIHGDEVFTSLKILVDGTEIDTTQDFIETAFENFTVFVKSEVYHANTNNLAFYRNKRLDFTDNKLTITNLWTCADSSGVDIIAAPCCGIYSIDEDKMNGYATNFNNEFVTRQGTSANKKITGVDFYGDDYLIKIEAIRGMDLEKSTGQVAVLTSGSSSTGYREKAYLYAWYNATPYHLNNGASLIMSYSITTI